MTELDAKVKEWMVGIGFQDNTGAEVPNYQWSLQQFMKPSPIIQKLMNENREWSPLEDISLISPELAKLFYLLVKGG